MGLFYGVFLGFNKTAANYCKHYAGKIAQVLDTISGYSEKIIKQALIKAGVPAHAAEKIAPVLSFLLV